MRRFIGLVALAIATAGCGGGGGGGSGSTSGSTDIGSSLGGTDSSTSAWLQLTPATVNLTTYERRGQSFSINVKSSKPIAQGINVGIVDPKGLIDTKVTVDWIGALEYRADLSISDKLAPGTYSGKLELRLCEDDPVSCAKPIEGSPWHIPLTVTVKASTNLTTLAELPSLGAWSSIGGNSRHTGYVPGQFDPTKFTQRWNHSFKPGAPTVGGARTLHQNGITFVFAECDLNAIDETTGKSLWSHHVPGESCPYSLPTPTLVGDKVIVAATEYGTFGSRGFLRALDQATGALIYDFKISGSVESLVSVGDFVYINSRIGLGYERSISKFVGRTGEKLWSTVVEMESEILSADDQFLYAGTPLRRIPLSDGVFEPASSAPLSFCAPSSKVVGPNGLVYMTCGKSVSAHDSVRNKWLWSVETSGFVPAISLAGTTLYALSGGVLEARSVVDGGLLWSAKVNDYSPYDVTRTNYVLATDNLVFASDSSNMKVVDIASHKVVWSFPHGGPMAISSRGVLYLSGVGSSGIGEEMVAINLQ